MALIPDLKLMPQEHPGHPRRSARLDSASIPSSREVHGRIEIFSFRFG